MVIGESSEMSDENMHMMVTVAESDPAANQVGDNADTSSFLTGVSQISSNVVPTDNNAKDKTYWSENPLIIVFGIGDYDADAMPSLVGVHNDYKKCIYTFLKMGYCVLYQNKNNNTEYIDKYDAKWKTNGKTKIDVCMCSENAKKYWVDDEIEDFFVNVKDYVLKYQHDGCIFLLSCHGDSEQVIIDSKGEEVSLLSLFSDYDGRNCQYLVDKPKIIFVDACRGSMKAPIILPEKDVKESENNNIDLEVEDEAESKMIELNPQAIKTSNALQSVNETNATSLTTTTKMQNKNTVVDDWYHSQANFIYVYANPDGYATADGGTKGGYLIGAVKRVFSNLEISLNQTLNDIIQQIRAETKNNVQKGTLECVEVVDKMTYKVRFQKRK